MDKIFHDMRYLLFSGRSLLNIYLLIWVTFLISCSTDLRNNESGTIALWAFDEQLGIYPSCVLSDHSEHDFPLVLGPGGMIVPGKYGNALQPTAQPDIEVPESASTVFGLKPLPVPAGRTVEPMNWWNANFCALMTSGENHLRKEVGFKQPTRSQLNLGDFAWTVEFWFYPTAVKNEPGVIFEIGQGPRGENDHITRLSLSAGQQNFIFHNQPAGSTVELPSRLISGEWQHVAFVYDPETDQILHYLNGRLQHTPVHFPVKSLPPGDEDYMSIGREGLWANPLAGKIDELRFSNGMIYENDFAVPGSFSYLSNVQKVPLEKSIPLLFSEARQSPFQLGDRKHLFIDNALCDEISNLNFVVNPPARAERVIGSIQGSFRKHLNVIEDEEGMIRLYNAVANDYLAVRISGDGINWQIPDLPSGHYKGHTNIVLHNPAGMGEVFIDPNAPPEEKWKYLSGFHSRGVFIYTSPDGYDFSRKKTAVLPFWAGSQSNIFYDSQQRKYIAYHRADFARGVGKATQREFVMTETDNLINPWPFHPSTQEEGWALAKKRRIKDTLPFYLDNGLLTPGGFAFEYPDIFKPVDGFDPIDTDVYVPKAIKYPWAPDVYLAFPVMYYHYKNSSPQTRSVLGNERYQRGSGPLETQLAVSRDATNWKRYPRPTYVGIGEHQGRDVHTAYIAQGMVKRGNEIWQYYFGETQYHSAQFNDPEGRGVYRLIQRLDGFVSLDSPYDTDAYMITKPLIFKGNRLVLNIDTDATGYAQVGFLTPDKSAIPGFSVDECVYINGDFISTEVEWMHNTDHLDQEGISEDTDLSDVIFNKDVSALSGKSVRLIFRMRGAKLYAMQFITR